MGKSNKKHKAERINAIRKQYDSFIEEDKKRKDRNEYILEKLDKIRNTSAIAQVRNAPKDYFTTVNQNQLVDDRKDFVGKCLSRYEKPVSNSNVVSSINEQEILKLISKKYILIPRHINILEHDDNYLLKSNFDENGDWRKKYSILEELKQNKKQEEQETDLNLTTNINDGELKSNKIEEPNVPTRYLLSGHNQNSPDNDIDNIGTISNYDEVISNTEIDKLEEKNPEIVKNVINNSEYSQDFNKPILNSETENLSEHTDSEKQPMSPQITPTNTRVENVYVNVDNANEPHAGDTTDLTQKEIIQAEYEMETKPKEDIQLERVQYSNINVENQNLTETSQSENYQRDEGNKENSNKSNDWNSEEVLVPSSVKVPLPVENINLIAPNIDRVDDNVKDRIVEYQIEPENVEPTLAKIKPAEQDFDDTGHDAQINEFVAEQSEMFNSDPNHIEYAYNQTGSAVIDDYETHEDYAHDESYVYFQETAQQEVYSDDIDGHEETTEKYDPQYEAQYANFEDRNQIIDEHYDNYEGEVVDAQPQTYEQLQFELPDNNVVMEVEKELDAEQNYNIIPPDPEDNNIHFINEAMIPEVEGDTIDGNPAQRPIS